MTFALFTSFMNLIKDDSQITSGDIGWMCFIFGMICAILGVIKSIFGGG